ncbi:hypothetical protein ACVBEJ_06165 [Porticoccus sp. GXU_MW_L64]
MAAKPLCRLLLASLVVALAGCQVPAKSDLVPARLVSESQQPGAHPLARLISAMLDGAKVTLADDAFYNSSEVIIEGPRLGRTFEKPRHFRLWLKDGHCVLEHVESAQRFVAYGLECVAANPMSS